MAGFIQNMLWNSVGGFVDAAKKTGGEYAGNALIKAGDMIEGGGRSVGGGIEKAATGYGSKLSGQTYQASSASKALPSTARKPAVKRSNSMPPNTKASGSVAGAKKTVGGAKKAVGGVTGGATKTVGGVTGGATKTVGGVTGGVGRTAGGVIGGAGKTVGGVTGGAGKTVGGVTGGATRGVNGVVNGASKTAGGAVGGASKSVNGLVGGASKGLGGITGGATKATGGVVNNATRGVSGIAGGASKPLGGVVNNATKGVGGIVNGASKPVNGLGSNAQKAVPQGLPKPYNSTSAGSSYSNPFPSAKTAPIKPSMGKPAAAPVDPKTPYPGTNTLPGQGGRTPVKRSYKPAPTLGSQVAPGQKMTHIGAF